jgi:hypothetical protein
MAIIAFAGIVLVLAALFIAGFETEGVNRYSIAEAVAPKLGFGNGYQYYLSHPKYTYGMQLNEGSIPMLDPGGKPYLVREDKVYAAIVAGWKADFISKYVPHVGEVAFVNVTEEEANKRADEFASEMTLAMWKARAVAMGLALILLLVVQYGMQVAYRAVIFVAFGSGDDKKAAAA